MADEGRPRQFDPGVQMTALGAEQTVALRGRSWFSARELTYSAAIKCQILRTSLDFRREDPRCSYQSGAVSGLKDRIISVSSNIATRR